MNKEVIHILNDLVTINKNRITGYKEVLHELKDEATAAYCREMIHQGEQNNKELAGMLEEAGFEPEDKTITTGFVYNTWMDLVYGEEKEPMEDIDRFRRETDAMAVKAYEAALKEILPGTKAYDLVNLQMERIKYPGRPGPGNTFPVA